MPEPTDATWALLAGALLLLGVLLVLPALTTALSLMRSERVLGKLYWHVIVTSTTSGGSMASAATPERRRFDRNEDPAPLHRRHGQLVHITERRRRGNRGFDIASALELHLDDYPTREAMLELLASWFYDAQM